MAFWSNLWNAIKKYVPFVGGYYQKLEASQRRGETEPYAGFMSYLENAFTAAEDKYLGTGLTQAEQEANAFTAEREDIAWQREMEASSTEYQRKVADLQAAGLNPMLAIGGSGNSVPAATSHSSVSPVNGNLSDLVAIATLPSQMKLMKAEADNLNASASKSKADAAKAAEDTRASRLANDFFEDTYNLRKILLSDTHERNQWERDVAEQNADTREGMLEVEKGKAEHYNSYIDKSADLIQEQIDNQPLQRALLRANAREANASASYKAAMQSVDVKLAEASEEKTREELEILKIEARLKNGVYTEQTIEALGKAARAEASIKIVMDAYQRGDYRYASLQLQKMFHTLEKNGELPVESWTIGTATHSTNGAASAAALPY